MMHKCWIVCMHIYKAAYVSINARKHEGITNSELAQVIRTEGHAVVLNSIGRDISETRVISNSSQTEIEYVITGSVRPITVHSAAVCTSWVMVGNKMHFHSQRSL